MHGIAICNDTCAVECNAMLPPQSKSVTPSGHAGDDAKILRDLFDGTGVMSALDHTKIEGANDPQQAAAEAEAAEVAKRAAEALRRSRRACQVCPPSSNLLLHVQLAPLSPTPSSSCDRIMCTVCNEMGCEYRRLWVPNEC